MREVQLPQFYALVPDVAVPLRAVAKFRERFVARGEPIYGGAGLSLIDSLETWMYTNHDVTKTLPSGIMFLADHQNINRLYGVLHVRYHIPYARRQTEGDLGFSVIPEARGRGLGSMLLSHGLNTLKVWGYTDIVVTTAIDNIACRTLLERKGGVVTGPVMNCEGEACLRYVFHPFKI